MFRTSSSLASPFWNITNAFSSNATTTDGDHTDNDAGSCCTMTVDGNSGHEMIDRTLSQVEGGFSVAAKDASFLCAPYKAELFQQQLDEYEPGSNRRTALISALQDLGVKVFIIDSVSTPSTADVVHHVKRVVKYMARENCAVRPQHETATTSSSSATGGGPLLGYQRCLLYQDNQGRLFNLVLSEHAVGPVQQFVEYCDQFSNSKAVVVLLLLIRTLPLARNVAFFESFQPALLALIVGLVLPEETSLSWLNATMMVRAAPSVSAHSLMSLPCRDAMRKWSLLCLVLAGAMTGTPAQVLSLMGIISTCVNVLANLGSRAWYNLQWQPQQYDGIGATIVAYWTAVALGMTLPFMGHRDVRTGGRAAMEHVLTTSLVVAAIYAMAGVQQVQTLILGVENTQHQGILNMTVGIWWLVTTLGCLILAAAVPFYDAKPFDSERFLYPDHSSPAGYKVPCLPDYEIDPALARTGGIWFLSLGIELCLSMLLVGIAGAGMLSLVYTQWDEEMANQVQAALSGGNDL